MSILVFIIIVLFNCIKDNISKMLVFVILIQIFIDVRPYSFVTYMYVPIDKDLPIFVKRLFVYWDIIYNLTIGFK